jgi:CubicO group peptidase (beta-lactamase class C family)
MSTIDGYVHPAFAEVAEKFRRLFRKPGSGGGALAVRLRGEPMVDIWAGSADAHDTRPWTPDTMAMSFSTTKGVSSTVIHRLADRGLISYDEPVAAYWPEFGSAGKHDVTVRQLLSHQAGLHNVRDICITHEILLDHLEVEQQLARSAPSPRPGTAPGYHGFTYGWLISGLARAITGKGMADLVQEELAEPLKTDGLHIGAFDDEVRSRVAPLIFGAWGPVKLLGTQGHRTAWTRRMSEAFFIPAFDDLLSDPGQRILLSEMPAVNGVFTARGLATMYGALANGGQVDDVELLSRQTVHELGRVVTRDRDYVLGIRMRWRLGYHQAFTGGRSPRRAFGHFGFGGSGGWADPATGLSLGFVTNRLGSATTPIADGRLIRLGGLVVAAAARLR